MDMNAVVIGGSSGIGKEVCARLLGQGYTVYNASRRENDNKSVINLDVDVSKAGQLEKVFGVLPCPDVVVYSAGFSMAAPIEYVEESDYRYLFEVNYFGLLKTVQLCAKPMRESGSGKIIAVSSMGGVMPIAFDAYYSSSKAAVDMLIKEANIELNPYNVFLTAMRPGGTATRFTFKRKVYPEQDVGVYGDRLNKAAVALADIEQSGMTAGEVADCILNVVESKKPPQTVSAGLVNKSLSFAKRLLPDSVSALINKNTYLQ